MRMKIWKTVKGADDAHIKDAETTLRFKFPADFAELYSDSDGVGVEVGYSYVDFWSIDSILAANDIFGEIEKGRYVFFADADDGIDSFAYDKRNGEIYVFSTEYGIDQGRYCAESIEKMIEYIENI